MIRLLAFLVLGVFVSTPASALPTQQSVQSAIRSELVQYLAQRSKTEHISAIEVSVSPRGGSADIDAAAGTASYGGSTPVKPPLIWPIGSNTKSFTSVLLLKLEATGKLSIDDGLAKWLPQYPAWKTVTIRQLLNMTGGIPTYDADMKMQIDYAANPYRKFTPAQLIAYVYPKVAFRPGKGYTYSNTSYILAQLIIERASGKRYATDLQQLLTPLGLKETYYTDHIYPAAVQARMTSGYFYNRGAGNEGLAPLLGRDQKAMSQSWAQGAGAIAASLADLNRWSRGLFRGPLLTPKQRAALTSLVSFKTGRPIAAASAADPRGFGLGVAQLHTPRGNNVWFYEGELLGYRTAFEYLPKQDVVIAIALNSQPDGKEDHIGKLFEGVENILRQRGML